MFCVTGDVAFSSRGRDKPGEGLWVLKIRRYRGSRDTGQRCVLLSLQPEGRGPVSPLPFLGLGNNTGRRKEKPQNEVRSSETRWREGGKHFPVADRFQFITVDFGLKPSFQPSRQAEVNLSDVIFIRTTVWGGQQSPRDPSACDWLWHIRPKGLLFQEWSSFLDGIELGLILIASLSQES